MSDICSGSLAAWRKGESGNQAAELRGRWLYFVGGGVFRKAVNGGKSRGL